MTTSLTEPRECKLYEFEGWDPHANYATKTVVYVGETGRMPFLRLLEHVYAQPWSDTITGWRVLDEVYPDKAAVLRAEKAHVESVQPLYNVEWNIANPRRILPEEARRQAAERGKSGRPRPHLTHEVAAAGAGVVRSMSVGRKRAPLLSARSRRRLRRAAGVAVLWLALASAAWWLIGSAHLAGRIRLADAALTSTAVLLGYWSRARRKRALSRRLAGAMAGLVGLFLAVTVGWPLLPVLVGHLPSLAHHLHDWMAGAK